MIRLLVFDLDGTLVQTEKLKAESYARAAHQLDDTIAEAEVMEAYKDVVGQSREEVATALMKRFGLEDEARAKRDEFDVEEVWQGYVEVRLQIYHAMIEDAGRVRAHAWPHATRLLRHAHAYACRVALATTSERDVAETVLRALDLQNAFDVTVTADDVVHTKPNPEAYLRVLDVLGVAPDEGLALEDSPAGVRAARAAGLRCIAVPTDFTRDRIYAARDDGLINAEWIVENPERLADAVRSLLEEVNGPAPG